MTATSYSRHSGKVDLSRNLTTEDSPRQAATWEDVKHSKFYIGGNLRRSIVEGRLVDEARAILISYGYKVSSGKWSDYDHASLIRYQAKNGLDADGLLGPLTAQKMGIFKGVDGKKLSEVEFSRSLAADQGSSRSSTYGVAVFPKRPRQPELSGAEISNIVSKACAEHGVSESLVHAVIKAESEGYQNAVSKKGARGLMQLMPKTARSLGVIDITDPHQNIFGGTLLLSKLLKQFNGDESLALAGYNAGPGAVRKYNGIPPYLETQHYVRKVLARKELLDGDKGKLV